jgi:hypothetical protein
MAMHGDRVVKALEDFLDARDQLKRASGLRKCEPEARAIMRRARENLRQALEGTVTVTLHPVTE